MPTNLEPSPSVPSPPEWDHVDDGAHIVQFYEADSFLLAAVARYLGASLNAGDAGVVIATKPHREVLEAELRRAGVDLDTAHEQGRYVAFDAAETLSRFLIETSPDELLFADVVGGLIGQAAAKAKHGRVRAFGEMVALLWAERKAEVALRVEELWNHLPRKLP